MHPQASIYTMVFMDAIFLELSIQREPFTLHPEAPSSILQCCLHDKHVRVEHLVQGHT